MKLWTIFRFEFAYQIRRPWPWLFVVILLALDFLMGRDGSLSEMLYADFFVNSPFAVAKTTVFGSLIWLVMAAAIAGEAAARDVATGMHPLTYTTPVSKGSYLAGRFLAAFALNALLLLAVQAGILLSIYLPGVDAALLGPFRPAAFLTAYAFISLPNALVATAIQFGLALRSGRPMAGYFGSFLLVFMGFFVASLLLFKSSLGTLLDPIGIRFVVEDMAHSWTPIEQNRRLLALEGAILSNRLLWLGLALLALALTYRGFRFAHRPDRGGWKRVRQFFARRREAQQSATDGGAMAAPRKNNNHSVAPNLTLAGAWGSRPFGMATHAQQILAVAWDSFRALATSWAGLVLLVGIPLLSVPVVLDQMQVNGVALVPTTALVLAELTGSLADELSRWVIIPFLIVYFAGELVWRERDARLGEISSALPGSEWAPLLGKFLALALLLVLFLGLLATAGMAAQAIQGYYHVEPGLYLKVLFGLQLTDYLLFALLALAVHVVVDQKYVGHLVAILAFVFIALASLFGIEHNLLIYGAGPGWSYSDMRGFGPALGPWLWFKLYWVAWALLLAVVARLFWVRGREQGPGARLQVARRRFKRTTAVVAAVALSGILILGGFIFYNTNVLHPYRTAAQLKQRQATYEQRYARYAATPQPQLTDVKLRVEIYPERRAVAVRGTYCLVNRTAVAIDSIHLATDPDSEARVDLRFDRPATRVLTDAALGHHIYTLPQPLQPGDSLQLIFRAHVESRGFRESGAGTSVVANGTSFSNSWLPTIGYQPSRELSSTGDRRTHGLAPRPLMPSVYDVAVRQPRGAGVSFDAVVGTAQNQVAIAPGALRRTWAAGGRRYFHYVSDGFIGGEWAFFSAAYAVHEAQWQDSSAGAGCRVAIHIFHHPAHTAHLSRMVRSIKASLAYYTRQFGPYRHSYLNIIEVAGNGTGLHAEASSITHPEGFTLWQPKEEEGSLDLPYAVVAHEMAHQWTVPYARVEGAPVMSESLAWYYGIKAVEHSRGPEQRRRLLSFMHQPHPYPAIRRGEPLLRGLDPYLAYRRGPFALYALSEYIGEARVNRALRRLLERHRLPAAPLATTLDLYRELQAETPDSLQYLLHDLVEVNTYWELKTEQATATPTKAGQWQVTLRIKAHKVVLDSAGIKHEIPMHDWVDVGVMAPRVPGQPAGTPLYLRRHRIRSGKQTITVTVPRQPSQAGLDPNRLLIDLQPEDNERNVTLEK
ncbi:ABC transporter permease/M1 family aminopeptidase [Hymenobacter lucidus]|uniref:Peptidase M1 membrane alanine aminopeptidase domain-containing protein n=1 Tax=Hymenobacter lucidus TaxID=2880930 RepID=A0ABS8ANF0_9BACT|nr:hypothetical protein [Hymenobacter lucidus]MCB2407705.1 hypothetical protein [Hymenobacter lucidus]